MKRGVAKKVELNVSRKPLGVKIFSILEYICAAFLFLIAILFYFLNAAFSSRGGEVIQSYIATPEYQDLLLKDPGAAAISLKVMSVFFDNLALIGTFFLVLGLICLLIAKGLWKGENWARIAESIFAVFGLLLGIAGLSSGSFGAIFGLILNGFIFWYFMFNKDVLKFFKVK